MKRKGFSVSPITNRIKYGMQNTEKHTLIGTQQDVTDEVIAAVFEWFMNNIKDESELFSLTYENVDYELVLRHKRAKIINQIFGTESL